MQTYNLLQKHKGGFYHDKIGINGFGRIGRGVSIAFTNPEVEVVAINDLTDAATAHAT